VNRRNFNGHDYLKHSRPAPDCGSVRECRITQGERTYVSHELLLNRVCFGGYELERRLGANASPSTPAKFTFNADPSTGAKFNVNATGADCRALHGD
jgi:hypothetical protein